MSGSTAAKLAQMILGVEALKGAKIVGAKLLKSPGLYEVDWKTDKMSFMARVELVDGAPQIRLSTDAIAPGKGLAETVRELLEWTAGEQLRQAKLIREMLGQRPPSEDEQKEQGEGEGEDKGKGARRGQFWPMERDERRAEVLSAVKAIVGASGSVWLEDVFWKVDKAAEYCDKDRTYIVELEEERDRLKHELSKEERQSKEWCDALKGAKAALLVMRADRDSLKACALEPAVCILGPYNPYDHIDSAHRLLTGMGVAVLGTLTDRITSLGGTLKASLSWHRDGCQCPTHAVDDTAGDEDFEDGRPIDVEAVEAAYRVEGVYAEDFEREKRERRLERTNRNLHDELSKLKTERDKEAGKNRTSSCRKKSCGCLEWVETCDECRGIPVKTTKFGPHVAADPTLDDVPLIVSRPSDEDFVEPRDIDVAAAKAAHKPRPALVGNEEVPASPKCDVEQCIVDHDAAEPAETFQCESMLGDPSND